MLIAICTWENAQKPAPGVDARVFDVDPAADQILANDWRDAHIKRHCPGQHLLKKGTVR